MRRRTITLVVVGLVMALFVLPAAANAMLGDTPAEDDLELDYGYDEVNHQVFYRIFDASEEPDPDAGDCFLAEGWSVEEDPDGGFIYLDENGDEVADFALNDGCIPVDIEGPNGQVNHGTFVSSMVHELKEEYDKDTMGPFGQWVKEFAHDDKIGKGDLKVYADGDDVDGDDIDDGDDAASTSSFDKSEKPEKSEKSNNGKGNGKGNK